ncbi:sulfotransferase domain-containing protein [Aliiruegeria haliotis]|uniref:Sulfotransferase domain-containing protein n=2 Tax=Aliiruegeria haliotis TaxID=1280846 RepID=A0A2T0S057_9RHOB|nr:sulfotransferase domain-containing protein [Aliiruegeria haliotis]
MLPSVIFVGPTKCGTTWVDSYLRTRSDVVLPTDTKETFFFDKVFERGKGWYEKQFADRPGIAVEVAPSLFHKPQARSNLAQTLPQARIVVIYRDPLDRAVSHYFHYRKEGARAMPIREMAEIHPDIVDAGMFHKNAMAWEELFPGQVSYLRYSDLRQDVRGFCTRLCATIGIPDTVPPDQALSDRKVNAASVPRSAGLARITRRGAEFARRVGAHGLVNRLRSTSLKGAVFSGGEDVEAEREGIRAEVGALSEALCRDRIAFEKMLDEHLSLPRGRQNDGSQIDADVIADSRGENPKTICFKCDDNVSG